MKYRYGRGTFIASLLSLLVCGVLWGSFTNSEDVNAQIVCNVANCMEQGGARWSINNGGVLGVATGGEAAIETGGVITIESGGAGAVESGGSFDFEATGLMEIEGVAVTATAADLNTGRGGRSSFNICGDSTTIDSNTVYYGPDVTLTADTAGGQKCDINAAGDVTEASAFVPVFYDQAFYPISMTCRQEGDMAGDITYTLRNSGSATVPSVACTIEDDELDCVADVQATTAIAAGNEVAVAASAAIAVGANGGFVCVIEAAF